MLLHPDNLVVKEEHRIKLVASVIILFRLVNNEMEHLHHNQLKMIASKTVKQFINSTIVTIVNQK